MNSNRDGKGSLIPLWIFTAAAVGIIGGFFIRNYTQNKPTFVPRAQQQVGEVEQILRFVKERYVDSVDINELENSAIANTLAGLDPHSVYVPVENMAREYEMVEGEYEGIGIEFFMLNDTISVVSAVSGGPAESVGIRAGDKIVTVNDSLVAGVGIADAKVVKLLKGRKNTKVRVGVARKGIDDLVDFTITRGEIPINSLDVAYMIDEETGFIKINSFSSKTHDEFRVELNKLVKSGMKNLILDLRGNGGGVLKDCLEICDELIDGDKKLLSIEGNKYRRRDYHALRTGAFEQGKVAVLIDEGTASASEIVAGAVQDWDRGIIIGRRSFGKGLVQEPFDLKDGSSLRLTIARYYTPSGRSIQRSYENGNKAYFNEWNGRFSHGELQHKDSIVVDTTLIKYTLANERPVYGGGGIIPDVFVPIDTANNNQFMRAVYLNSLIPQFTYDYYANHVSTFDSYENVDAFENEFFIHNGIYNSFIDFAKEKVKEQDFSESEIATSRKDISRNIKALLAEQKFGSEGLYGILNDDDRLIRKAIESFEEKRYAQLLLPAG